MLSDACNEICGDEIYTEFWNMKWNCISSLFFMIECIDSALLKRMGLIRRISCWIATFLRRNFVFAQRISFSTLVR